MKRSWNKKHSAIRFLVVMLGIALTVSAAAYTFTSIDPPGSTAFSEVWGINSHGELVGTYGANVNFFGVPFHGFFRGTDGSFTTIDAVIPGVNVIATSARAINPRGEIVGFYVDSANTGHGYLRGTDGSFTTIDFPGAVFIPGKSGQPEAGALGINPAGDIVGTYYSLVGNTIKTHGYLQSTDGTFTSIDFPGAITTNARAINPSGEVVGRYDVLDMSTNTVKTHGYLRSTDGTFTSIDFPGASLTNAGGIDPSGEIVGFYRDNLNVDRGFLRGADGSFATIDAVIPGVNVISTHADGINPRGEIVGRYSSLDPTTSRIRFHGFLRARRQ